MKFKRFLKESKGPSGEEWETLITYAWNGEEHPELITKEVIDKYWEAHGETAKKIASDLRAKGLTGKLMEQTGSGGKININLNPRWRGTNKTPKTDMLIQNGARISLKKAGGSQFMSAQKEEALSTFEAAMSFVGENTSEVMKLVTLLKDNMTDKNLVVGQGKGEAPTIGNVKKKKKQGEELDDREKTVIKYDEMHTVMKKEARDFFMDPKNIVYKEFFVYEAASGETKFGTKSMATADSMVKFDVTKSTGDIDPIGNEGVPSSEMKALAKKLKWDINFKSGSSLSKKTGIKTRTAYSVMRVQIGEGKEQELPTFKSIFEETSSQYDDLLVEGKFTSFFRTLWDRVWGVLKALIKIGKQAIQKVLEFFGLEVKSVQASGPSWIFEKMQ
jgi:hypothetical protein